MPSLMIPWIYEEGYVHLAVSIYVSHHLSIYLSITPPPSSLLLPVDPPVARASSARGWWMVATTLFLLTRGSPGTERRPSWWIRRLITCHYRCSHVFLYNSCWSRATTGAHTCYCTVQQLLITCHHSCWSRAKTAANHLPQQLLIACHYSGWPVTLM